MSEAIIKMKEALGILIDQVSIAQKLARLEIHIAAGEAEPLPKVWTRQEAIERLDKEFAANECRLRELHGEVAAAIRIS